MNNDHKNLIFSAGIYNNFLVRNQKTLYLITYKLVTFYGTLLEI